MNSALCVGITFNDDYTSIFINIWGALKKFILKKVQLAEHTAVSEIVDALLEDCEINKYKAETICEVIIASMDSYRKNFNVAVNSYFQWVELGMHKVEEETKNGQLYLY